MTPSGLGLSLTSRDVVEPEEHGHGRRGAKEVSRVRCEKDGDVDLDMLLPTIYMLWSMWVEPWRSPVGRGE